MASELDAKVAECLGWRFWKTHRGGYMLCVRQKPDDREPWTRYRNADPSQYEECTADVANTTGFFGDGIPRFSSCPMSCEDVKAEIRRRGWDYTVTTDKYLPEHRSFNCEVSTYVTNTSMKVFQGATEYEAVCKAFVAACGREGTA